MGKICSKCGKEKPLTEFYKQGDKYRARCKACCSYDAKSRRESFLSYTNNMYFVYFVYDFNNELFYIGKTNDLYNRLRQHQQENRFLEDDINYVEFELLNSLCDASVREIYYINKYKPRLNNRDIFDGDLTCTIINELPKTKIFRYDRTQFKNDLEQAILNYNSKINLKPYKKSIIKIDPNTMTPIRVYDTCREAELDNNIATSGVSRAAKSGGKAGGFYWQYLNETDKNTDRFKN